MFARHENVPSGFRIRLLRTRNKVASRLQHFSRSEDGAMLVMGLFVFLMILMLGGIGVDMMHYERERSKLQYTLDRAVLAAADLDQPLPPKEVVRNYFDKAGLAEHIKSINVVSGINFRNVSATAASSMPTQFMHMMELDELTVPAAGAAEERIDSIEISLVLDVSGSMNSNSRLTNLKVAAKDFVETMDDNSADGDMSISIIPYATQVAVTDDLLDTLNVTTEHSYSNCINFKSSDFSSSGMSSSDEQKRTMHFDPWRTWDGRDNEPKELVGLDDGLDSTLPVCEAMDNREVLVLQKNVATLQTYIDNLTARGNTSIDIGMKWGTALLDPSLRTSVNTLVGNGNVPSDFTNRPSGYDDGETLKVIVLMTDGKNTSQYYLNDDYRDGPSEIWFNDDENKYSTYDPSEDAYYWDHSDQWADHPYGQDGYGCVGTSTSNWTCEDRTEPGSAANVAYPDLWAYTTLKANAKRRYYPFMNDNTAYNKWYYDVRSYVNAATKNSRTQTICDAAKNQGVIVFTIGFEAPTEGQVVLEECASSDAHYFDVDGLEISDAFASIASSIRKLRLTQ